MLSHKQPAPGAGVSFPLPVVGLVDELLHAMGQPLTVLGSLHLTSLRPPEDVPAFCAEMAAEVDRLSSLYRALRDLFGAEFSEGEVAVLPLNELIRLLEPAWRSLADRRSIKLEISTRSGPKLRARRTQQALDSIFSVALDSVSTGSTIRLWSFHDAGSPGLVIQGGALLAAPVRTSRLAIRTAEALLQAEGASVHVKLNPFTCRIEFHA